MATTTNITATEITALYAVGHKFTDHSSVIFFTYTFTQTYQLIFQKRNGTWRESLTN